MSFERLFRPIFLTAITVLVLSGCQPAALPSIVDNVAKVWKAKTVKADGVVVYELDNLNSLRPAYSNFKLELIKPDVVRFTDLDGRQTQGKWTISTDNQRIILQDLTPSPSATSGNIEFYILTAPTADRMELKRTNQSRKTGNTVNEYVLIAAQ